MQPTLAKLVLDPAVIKYSLLVLTMPLWWPFVRELWKEFNLILEEEGGLLGRKPTDAQLAEIRKRRAAREAALVRDLREEEQARGRRGRRTGPRPSFGASTQRAGSTAVRPAGRRGFGPPR